eukprot:GHVT01090534.1.p2 GENE.GHVT01090534.1~~GHVT01090534.1.p2  ORF type:complete len:125 (-),score=19.46 GHVT01090534.1:2031-2405(-)
MMYCCSPQQPRGAHARHVQPLCLELHSIHCGGGLPQLDGPIDGPTLSLTPGRGIAQTAGKRAGASACQSLKPRGTLGIHAVRRPGRLAAARRSFAEARAAYTGGNAADPPGEHAPVEADAANAK